jgi:hypothetical protein
MNNFLKLKEFFTLEEARKYLSDALDTPIQITDLYRLGIDKRLIISVRLIDQVSALAGQLIEDPETNFYPIYFNLATGEELENPYEICLDEGLKVEENKWLVFDDKVHFIDGIWDLTMIGMESLDIEKLYHEELGGGNPKTAENKGVFLQNGILVCKLQIELALEPTKENRVGLYRAMEEILSPKNLTIDDYFDDEDIHQLFTNSENDKLAKFVESMSEKRSDMERFEDSLTLDDHGHQFVIKTQELIRFVQSLQEEEPAPLQEDKPLSSKERTTLHTLIGALLKNQDLTPPYKGTAPVIQLMVETSGMSLSENTIRKILRDVSALIG